MAMEANPHLSVGQETLDPLHKVDRNSLPRQCGQEIRPSDFAVRFRKVKKCEDRSIYRFLCLKAITDGLG
jgi:hypothetical protein